MRGGASSSSSTAHERADRPAARALRAQGIDAADVGGHGRAAPRGELGGRSRRRRSRTRSTRCRARSPSRDGPRSARNSCAPATSGARGRLRPPRTALRARVPALVLPLAVSNQRTDEYGGIAGEPSALSPRGLRRRARRLAGDKPITVRISATDWYAGGNDAARRRRDRPRIHRARRGRHRRLVRPGHQRGAARVRPLVPDAVRRPDPPRGRAPRRSRSAPSPRTTT